MQSLQQFLVAMSLGICLVGGGSLLRTSQQADSATASFESYTASAEPEIPCFDVSDSTLPNTLDAGVLSPTTQAGALCFAWKDFIALNQPAAAGKRGMPAADVPEVLLGEPGDAGHFKAAVWQTYKRDREVFLPKAAPPLPWNAEPPPSPECPAGAGASDAGTAFARVTPCFLPDDSLQPHLPDGGSKPGRTWLADTSGNLVWFETRLNEAEFQYIVDAGLYNAEEQWKLSRAGTTGVNPPPGSIEIKAAWRELRDPSQYSRYLMTDAYIPAPGGSRKRVQLGLVGFHIIHKVSNQPMWMWFTFEHVDNAPTEGKLPGVGDPKDTSRTYSFYDSQCTSPPRPSKCFPSDSGTVLGNCDGGMPAYSLDAYFDGSAPECAPYPIQVVRRTALPSDKENPVQQTNDKAWVWIRGKNKDSVFQYYQLIHAMWWNNPSDSMNGGVPIPIENLRALAPQEQTPVANTVLETYAQQTNCLTCHPRAPVAVYGDGGRCGPADASNACAADFSFVFQKAQLPAKAPAPR